MRYAVIAVIVLFIAACAPKGVEIEAQPVGSAVPAASSQSSAPTVAAEQNATASVSCSDTDGGNKPETKGTVTVTQADGKKVESTDECVGQFVSEQYCEGDDAKSKNVKCEKECKDGACV